MAARGRTIFGTTLTIIAIALIAFFVFVYSGWYDVAASAPHGDAVRWTLDELTERSIARQAGEATPPADYTEDMVAHGLDHYVAMCEDCHGGVGVDRGEIGQGLNPRPPHLDDAAEEYTEAELFWILKHGIKFTGMPALGPTHSDEEIWGIVGFLRTMPSLTAEEYSALAAGSAGHHGEDGAAAPATAADSAAVAGDTHTHADGTTHLH